MHRLYQALETFADHPPLSRVVQQLMRARDMRQLTPPIRAIFATICDRPELAPAAVELLTKQLPRNAQLVAAFGDDPELQLWLSRHVMKHEGSSWLTALPEQITRFGGQRSKRESREQILRVLDSLAGEHRTGVRRIPCPQRLAIAGACAAVFSAHSPDAPRFAEARLALIDDEAVTEANRRPAPRAFSVNDTTRVPDLTRHGGTQGGAAVTHTRKAQMMELDGATWRVKEIAYGPRAAANEVLNSCVIALTGIAAPITRLARRDVLPNAVASLMMPDFMDLGDFVLARQFVLPLIREARGDTGAAQYDALRANFDEACAAREELDRIQPYHRGPEDPTMKRKFAAGAKRLSMRRKMFELLPDRVHQEIAKAQFLSHLIGDLDFVNFEGFNAGFLTSSMEVAVLDQGNSGIAGFKGGQKTPQNLVHADARAKPDDPFPPNRVAEEEHRFGEQLAPSRSGVGAIARSIPVAAFLGKAIRADTETAERSRPGQVFNAEMASFSGQMEGAWRLSLIPDEAFRRICAMHWPEPDDPAIPYPDSHSLRPTAADYAHIYIKRRSELVAKFSQEEMREWERRFPERAQAAYGEVGAALAHLAGIHLRPRASAGQGFGPAGDVSRPRSAPP